MKKVQKRIAERRQALELTQLDLAQALGVSKTAISRLEAGKTQITLENLRRIAEALQTSPAYLLGEDIYGASALTTREAQLLAYYRSTDARGQATILALAEIEKNREAQS